MPPAKWRESLRKASTIKCLLDSEEPKDWVQCWVGKDMSDVAGREAVCHHGPVDWCMDRPAKRINEVSRAFRFAAGCIIGDNRWLKFQRQGYRLCLRRPTQADPSSINVDTKEWQQRSHWTLRRSQTESRT